MQRRQHTTNQRHYSANQVITSRVKVCQAEPSPAVTESILQPVFKPSQVKSSGQDDEDYDTDECDANDYDCDDYDDE